MHPAEEANITRFDGRKEGFYEVYFIEVQDADCASGLWVRYTLHSPKRGDGPPVAELWAMYFDREDPTKRRALKKTVPFKEARVGTDRFSLCFADAELTQTGCRGAIGEGDDRIEWDLTWGQDKLLIHYPFDAMYSGPFPKAKVTSPHYDMRASGFYTAGDKRWDLDAVPGQQSHIWGTQHALRWIWCHCNTFAEDETAVFEGLSAQVKVGPITAPPLTFYSLHYKGRDYIFNAPKQMARTNESRTDATEHPKASYRVCKWIVGGGDEELRFRGEVWGDIEAYVGVRYTDPSGRKLVCSHNKVAFAKIEIMRRDEGDAWRVVDTLTSKGVALEFVGSDPDPRVKVLV